MHNFGEDEYPYQDLPYVSPTREQVARLNELIKKHEELMAGVRLMMNQSPNYLQVAELICELSKITKDEDSLV